MGGGVGEVAMIGTREWIFGDSIQRQWAALMARRGSLVLPTHELQDNAPGTKAPMLWTWEGLLVSPDLLLFSVDGAHKWHEVKAKATATWHRNCQRWEHGCDFSLLREYSEVQERSGYPVFFVIFEELSPADPVRQFDMRHGREFLQVSRWLVISLAKVLEIGERRESWPGGTARPQARGRKGAGGWLWDRSRMREYCPEHDTTWPCHNDSCCRPYFL